MMKNILTLLMLLLTATMAPGQELTVTGFAPDPTDMTAATQRRDDFNGQPCALVKVHLGRPGATFEGNVLGDTPYHQGEYLVYMSRGSKMLRIGLEGCPPLLVNFEKPWGIAGLVSQTTYVLSLSLTGGPAADAPQMAPGLELTVKDFAPDPTDMTAATQRRDDLGGQPCALVKVHLGRPGATFEGNVLGDTPYHQGEYLVYMSRGSKMLRIGLEGCPPLLVNFEKPWGIAGLVSLTTYVLSLSLTGGPGADAPQAAGAASPALNAQPSADAQPAAASDPGRETFTVGGVRFTMVRVGGGTFTMGATSEQGSDAFGDEQPAHKVTLSTYSIGETEVTQELWLAVMGSNPSYFKGPKRPVECVSWNDCKAFIEKLNTATGRRFRLPTEAEWEFAARGGSHSRGYKYAGSNNLGDVAWYWANSGDERLSGDWDRDKIGANHCQTHDVAQKRPNELGLYDMSGGVMEWCSDWFDSDCYKNSPQTNPMGPTAGSSRVIRGGGWGSGAGLCRSSCRSWSAPTDRNGSLGLRLVLSE